MKRLWTDIVNNSALLLVSRIFAKLATVAVLVVLARILGADSFGTLNAILALSLFAGLISDFGLVLPTIRAISRKTEESREILQGTVTVRLVGGLCGLLVVFLFGMWLTLPLPFVLLLGLTSVLESFATAIARSFEGRREIKVLTAYVVAERIIFSIVVISAVLLFRTIDAVVLAHVLSYAISLTVAAAMFTRRIGPLRFTFSFAGVRAYVRMGMPLLLTSIVSTLFYRADVLLLSRFRPHAEAGIYSAAFRLIDAQLFIPMTIMVSIFPVLSRMHAERDSGFGQVFRRSFLTMVSIGTAITVFLVLAGPFLIHILYTQEYSDSVRALRILSLMLPFYFANYLLTQSLVAIHQETVFSGIMIGVAILSVCLNLVLIPSFGYIGSSWIRVVGEAVAFASFLIAFRIKMRDRKAMNNVAKSTAPAYD